ncbi:MAG: alpha/beta hydrolase family protein, partial [Acidimicrobiia bacterium]
MLGFRVATIACTGALAFTMAACEDDRGSDASTEATDEPSEPAVERESALPSAATNDDRIYAVGYRDVTYVDPARPTAQNGDYAGAPDRTLAVRVWYPAEGAPTDQPIVDAARAAGREPFPLVLFSHGYLASGPAYGALTSQIAGAGYLVAAPTYPLSNGAAPGGPSIADVVNQPADASFVIDQVLDDPLFAPTIDEEHIAAAGHSLGAITTLGLSLASCCADKRLDAAAAFSGVSILGPDQFADDVPLLLIHGDRDGIVPYRGSVDAFADASAPKYLVTLLGGGHVEGFVGLDDERSDIV